MLTIKKPYGSIHLVADRETAKQPNKGYAEVSKRS